MSREKHDLSDSDANGVEADPATRDRPDASDAAFEQLNGGLRSYLRRRLRRAEDVEDLAQEVYLRLLRFTDIRQVKSPTAYVFRVALHVLYEFNVRQNRSPITYNSDSAATAAEHLPDSTALPEEIHDRQQLQATVKDLIDRLPPMQRLVLLLTTREDLSYDEIARKLGISASTARVHLFRAMATLRDEASKQGHT
jgi:RNA polymerase sigma factor (sigma-70 family)